MKELNVTATKVEKKGNTRRLLRHYVSAITYRKVKMAEANCIIIHESRNLESRAGFIQLG